MGLDRLQRVEITPLVGWAVDSEREKNLPLFLFEDEVAGLLRMTTEGLARQRREGREPGALGQKVGGRIRYMPHDLVRYIEEVYGSGAAEDLLARIEELQAKPPTKPPDS